MSRLTILCLPAMLLVGACSEGPGNGAVQTENEAVPADDGMMAAPGAMSNTDGTNSNNASGALGQSTIDGTMAPTGSDQSATKSSEMNPSGTDTTTGPQTGDTTTQGSTPPSDQ